LDEIKGWVLSFGPEVVVLEPEKLKEMVRKDLSRNLAQYSKWKGMETSSEGDFFVRSGPGTVKLDPNSAKEYIRTRFAGWSPPATASK